MDRSILNKLEGGKGEAKVKATTGKKTKKAKAAEVKALALAEQAKQQAIEQEKTAAELAACEKINQEWLSPHSDNPLVWQPINGGRLGW